MDLSNIQPFLDWLAVHQQWVVWSIFAIAFLESLAIAGIIIPGVLLLFGASAVAGSGILGVWPTLASALAGAILGDCLSFLLGKTLKDHIHTLWPFRNYPKWLANGEKFFYRHGGKSIFIGRFVGPIRPVLPLVAGMLDMPSLRFVSINFLSALGWAPLYILPGYLFGASMHGGISLPDGLGELSLLTLIITFSALLFIRLGHWQLHPDSRLYRALQAGINRLHSARLFWHWLAERRGEQPPAFPLMSLSLLIISLLSLALLWMLNNNSEWLNGLNQQVQVFFASLQHPWLDQLFDRSAQLADINCLRLITLIFIIWLLSNRHIAAALHIALAVFGTEILISALQSVNIDQTFPSAQLSGITLVSGLLASFIAQEMVQAKRWRVYTTTLLPIMLLSIATLYQGQQTLSGVIGGVLLGMAVCGATRVSFSRYNTRAIKQDIGLWISALLALIVALLFVIR